ncbi:MAG: hypothetical protein J6A88_03570 [Oscillospiraceae bacterium]|nr:hypothetical protein [Oscillospiraceae bacterium]
MARIKLTLSANAGGALQFGGHRLLIDAFHNRKVSGFSTLDEKQQAAIWTHPDFVNPELICVTHCHQDHYSKTMVDAAMNRWLKAKCLLPQQMHLTDGDMQIQYLPLIHEGVEFENTPHYGVFITWQGKNILISGDCRIAGEDLLHAMHGKQIDLAILNFPWLTLRKGRRCLENLLKPGKCIFWHLPFTEDDINGYRRSAEAALNQYPGMLLYNPFQTIEVDI